MKTAPENHAFLKRTIEFMRGWDPRGSRTTQVTTGRGQNNQGHAATARGVSSSHSGVRGWSHGPSWSWRRCGDSTSPFPSDTRPAKSCDLVKATEPAAGGAGPRSSISDGKAEALCSYQSVDDMQHRVSFRRSTQPFAPYGTIAVVSLVTVTTAQGWGCYRLFALRCTLHPVPCLFQTGSSCRSFLFSPLTPSPSPSPQAAISVFSVATCLLLFCLLLCFIFRCHI